MARWQSVLVLVALVMLVASPADAAFTLENSFSFDGKFYRVYKSDSGGVTWEASQNFAETLTGQWDLASINSEGENNEIFSQIQDEQLWFKATSGWTFGPYIGGFRDAGDPKFSGWQWVDGTGFTYEAWVNGQPDIGTSLAAYAHYGDKETLSGSSLPKNGAGWSWDDGLPSLDNSVSLVVENVPIPGTVVLFGSGLLGLVILPRRKR